jgi:hypothetical protein
MPIAKENAHHFDFYNLNFAFGIEVWPIFQRAKLLRILFILLQFFRQVKRKSKLAHLHFSIQS